MLTPPRQLGLRRQQGFTLIELGICIVIAALFLTLALPGFIDTVQSHRVRARANDLQFGFEQARATAITRGVPVTVRPAGNSFANGWRIFIDFDGDGVHDADDIDLQLAEAAEPGVKVSVPAVSIVTFDVLGQSNGGGTRTSYAVCSTTGTSPERRRVELALSGRSVVADIGRGTSC